MREQPTDMNRWFEWPVIFLPFHLFQRKGYLLLQTKGWISHWDLQSTNRCLLREYILFLWVQQFFFCSLFKDTREHEQKVRCINSCSSLASITGTAVNLPLIHKHLHATWGPLMSSDPINLWPRDSSGSANRLIHGDRSSATNWVSWDVPMCQKSSDLNSVTGLTESRRIVEILAHELECKPKEKFLDSQMKPPNPNLPMRLLRQSPN